MHTLFILILCLSTLIWATTHLVSGASALSHYYRISPLIIGLTLLAIGLAIPEFILGIKDALSQQTDFVINQMIESNIANIGLVLGLTIILRPPKIHSTLFRYGYSLLFISMLVIYLLMMGEYFSVADGCVLLLGSIALISYMVYLALHSRHDNYFLTSFQATICTKRTLHHNVFSLSLGFLIIPISAHYFILTIAQWAELLQIHKELIQSILIPIGTSLPILITCLTAAIKGQDQLAIGAILGTNMINLLAVLAFPGIINPSTVPTHIIQRDLPVMLALTLIIFLVNMQSKRDMLRWHGGILILIYACYVVSIVLRN